MARTSLVYNMRKMKPAAAVSFGLLALLFAATQDQPFFGNRQEGSGIRFRLENSPTPEKYLMETMTGGAAFLDYDGDGRIDVFLVNGAAILAEPGKAVRTDKSDPRFWNRLYRNLGGGRFQDVTVEAGVRGSGYGMGVAVGDYDNDGRADLFVTNYGRNELYHNEGNGRFREVAVAAGVAGGGFSTSAAFFDFDRDAFSTSMSTATLTGHSKITRIAESAGCGTIVTLNIFAA